MPTRPHVAVIGAGVTGLTTSLLLAQAGYTVTVLASHYPGDLDTLYASPWAGGHWRTFATSRDVQECDWDMQTYHWWVDIMNEERVRPALTKSSLKMQDSYSFYDARPSEPEWWADDVQQFRHLSLEADPIKSINAKTSPGSPLITYGEIHKAVSLDSVTYIRWLQRKASFHGVRFIRTSLPHASGLEKLLDAAQTLIYNVGHGKADIFINATGIVAGKLCADAKVMPIKGQTILVKGEAKATRTRVGDDYISYCIPRPGTGTTILGGTKEIGEWDTTVEPQVTRIILDRLYDLAPELRTSPRDDFEVISVQCGLRPGREGGARVELETVGKHCVVHSYGHGAAGFQNSIGSAREVLRLIEEHPGATTIGPICKL